MDVMKFDFCVHSFIIDYAVDPIEYCRLAGLFAREDRVELSALANDVDEYRKSTLTNQG